MESIEVLEEGKLLSFRFDEMLNYHAPVSRVAWPTDLRSAEGVSAAGRREPAGAQGDLVRDGFSRAGGAGCL